MEYGEGCEAGFRRNIRWSQKEFEATQKFAKMFQLPVSSDLGERDPNYLGYRFFSLLLDPANHPIADDHRAGLLRRYVVSRWRSSWSLRRRIMAIVLASLSALAKPSTAMTLILWMHEPGAPTPNGKNGHGRGKNGRADNLSPLIEPTDKSL